MATKIKICPGTDDNRNSEENKLHAYMRAEGLALVSYPNGNSGWENFGSRSVREVIAEYAVQNGYLVEWRAGNPHTCSRATLTKVSV